MSFFKKKESSGSDSKDASKNKKLAGDSMRIKVHRLVNNSPVEAVDIGANLVRDNDNNTIMLNDDLNFKEEFPGVQDALISDILYKLESRGLTKEKQLEKVKKAIEKQNTILRTQQNGKLMIGDEEVRININTEKQRLRLLKCTKFVLENKKGEGFFESIDINGNRVLNYLIRDGELIPYWFKTPDSDGEPVILVPDIVQRKKYYKDRTDEIINDFRNGSNGWFQGLFGLINKALLVLFVFGLIGWTFFLANWSSDLHDESLQPEIDALKVQNEYIRQQCSKQIANQIENNEVLIDVAKKYLITDTSPNKEVDKSNLQI